MDYITASHLEGKASANWRQSIRHTETIPYCKKPNLQVPNCLGRIIPYHTAFCSPFGFFSSSSFLSSHSSIFTCIHPHSYHVLLNVRQP